MLDIGFLEEECKKLGCLLKIDEDAKNHNTFRAGGILRVVVFPQDLHGFYGIAAVLRSGGVKHIIAGNGSNLLFPDGVYDGVVVNTRAMSRISCAGSRISAECGAMLSAVCAAARDNGLSGMENLYGIPGTVGGAVYMNAGAYGSETADVLESCAFYDFSAGAEISAPADAIGFAYRHSGFMDNGCAVLSCVFSLESGDAEAIGRRMDEVMLSRREKQPLELPSAGSVFKRSPGHYTGKLVEDAGLKGYSIGGARVSEKHAGFIVNTGGATSGDIRALISHIQTVVRGRFGVELVPEVRIVE